MWRQSKAVDDEEQGGMKTQADRERYDGGVTSTLWGGGG